MTVLSTLYGAVLLSSMLLPPLLIRTLGCKWTIVLSMGCYVAFSLGNFYASWYPGPRRPPGRQHPFARPAAPLLLLRMSSASARPVSGWLRPLPASRVPSAPSCGLGGPPSGRGLLGPQ